MWIDEKTDERLLSYGLQPCDCPTAGVDDMELQVYLEEQYGMKDSRVACGSGQDDIYYMDVNEQLHFEGKHWHESCLLVALADRLFGDKR